MPKILVATLGLNLNFSWLKKKRFTSQIVAKITKNHQSRGKNLYKSMYPEIFYHTFFPFAYGRSLRMGSFRLKFWLFWSRRHWKSNFSIFSKFKQSFEKQTTSRLAACWYLSMGKTWSNFKFWLWPPVARYLQAFVLKCLAQGSECYRRVPFHVRKQLEEQLEKDEQQGVIARVNFGVSSAAEIFQNIICETLAENPGAKTLATMI